MAPSLLTAYQEIPLPHAPALLYNNIVVHRNGDYVSYATPNSIVSVQTATGTPCFRPLEFSPGTYVDFLAGVTDPSTENIILVAALTNQSAVVIVNGQQTHFVSSKSPTETFTCAAVARIADTEEMVLVLGGSEGSVGVERYTLQGQTVTSAPPSLPVQAHEHRSITALDVHVPDTADAAEIASGDSAGHVVLWKSGSPSLSVASADTMDAITSVRWLPQKNCVAVAYGGGQIKIVERENGTAIVVIQAHSRWINTMTLDVSKQLLVSAGEDGQIFVWDANAADPNSVCVAHGSLSHELLTGVAMIGAHGIVAQLSYDVPKLRLMSPC